MKKQKQHPDSWRDALYEKNNLVIPCVLIAIGIEHWCQKTKSNAPLIINCANTLFSIISMQLHNFSRALMI
jgi:hypothetical protein